MCTKKWIFYVILVHLPSTEMLLLTKLRRLFLMLDGSFGRWWFWSVIEKPQNASVVRVPACV